MGLRGEMGLKYSKMAKCLNTFVAHCSYMLIRIKFLPFFCIFHTEAEISTNCVHKLSVLMKSCPGSHQFLSRSFERIKNGLWARFAQKIYLFNSIKCF